RIGELLLDRDVAVEPPQRSRIRDGGRDERPSLGGFAQFFHPDVIAGARQRLEVAHHLVPIQHRTVVADRVSEVTRGCWNSRQRGPCRSEQGSCSQRDHGKTSSIYSTSSGWM